MVMLFLVGSLVASAKPLKSVSGRVVDASTGEPLAWANVVVLNASDSSFVVGFATDEGGCFTIDDSDCRGILRVSCIGYTTHYSRMPLAEGSEIALSADAMMLGEVAVRATLPTTRIKGDALCTVVEGTVLAKAGAMSDVLNKIPMVSADEESGVEVFGRGQAEVYLNGQKVMDMTEIARLQSDQIHSIEVVRNPGARYSASTKAVVRIRLKKAQGDGLSFSEYVRGYYRYKWTTTDNTTLNYRKGGLDMTTSFYWVNSHRRMLQDNDLEYYSGGKKYVGLSSQDRNGLCHQMEPSLKINYQISPTHSIGAYYKFNHTSKDYSSGWLNTNTYEDGRFIEYSSSIISADGDISRHTMNGYYSGKVGQASVDFNVDALFDDTNRPGSTYEDIKHVDSDQERQDLDSRTLNRNHFWAARLVIARPLVGGNMSVGGEFTSTHRRDSYAYVSSQPMPVDETDTRINEKSLSFFADYEHGFGPLEVKAGVRFEHLSDNYYNFGVRDNEACRTTNDFFPTLSLLMPVGGVEMALSYRRDITRPSYEYLTSRMIRISRYTYQCGNPYLKPEYTHNVEFDASYKWAALSLAYSRATNGLTEETIGYPGSSDPLVSLIHTCNCAYDADVFTADFSARPVIGVWHPVWEASLRLQNYKFECKEGVIKQLDRPIGSFSWSNDIVLSCMRGLGKGEWRLSANATYVTFGDEVSYRNKPTFNAQLGIQHDIALRSAGLVTIDLRATDLFESAPTKLTLYGVRELSICRPARRSFVATATWRFNSARSKYKGTGAGSSQKIRI